jgi:hypothetical protein
MAAVAPFALRAGALLFDPTGKYRVTYSGAFAAIEATVSAGDGIKAEFGGAHRGFAAQLYFWPRY